MSQRAEIRSLTGLRGAAAMFIAVYHSFYFMVSNQADNSFSVVFLRHGYLSVDLFFVLSGYVMALTYAPMFAEGFRVLAFADFLGRRIGRIYPAYITVTAFVALYSMSVTPWHGTEAGVRLITNALLIQSRGLGGSIVGPSWSVSTELAAYFLFPLLIRAALQRRQGWAWAVTIAAAATLLLVATRSSATLHQAGESAVRHGPLDVYGTGTAFLVLRCLGGFTLGLVACRLSRHPGVKNLAGRAFAGDIAMALVLVLMLVPNSDVALVLLFVPLILTLAEGRSLSAAFLSSPVVYWFGLISYSFYLIHQPMDLYSRDLMVGFLARINVPHAYNAGAIAMMLPILILSAVCYYGVEKPGRAWSRRLFRATQSRGSPPTDIGVGAR